MSGFPDAIRICERTISIPVTCFGDRVFDLDSRIHFDEVELFRVRIVQEFDRARVVDAAGSAHRERRFKHLTPHVSRQVGRRCEFDDLLVTSLDRAIALEEMDKPSVPVPDQLHFDVLGALDELFQEDIGYPERGTRLRGVPTRSPPRAPRPR